MSLLSDMKIALRITSDAYDPEVSLLVDAAIADMRRVGVDPELLAIDAAGDLPADAQLVKVAVFDYCKANFGFDNDDKAFFSNAYRSTVASLLNSASNIAAIAVEEGQ